MFISNVIKSSKILVTLLIPFLHTNLKYIRHNKVDVFLGTLFKSFLYTVLQLIPPSSLSFRFPYLSFVRMENSSKR